MTVPSASRDQSQGRHLVAWVLQAMLATVFFAMGIGTLAEIPAAADSVDQVGLGDCFRLLVGIVEIIGAAVISLPDVAVLGAVWLATAMGFAVLTHLYILEDSPVRAAVLLLASVLVTVLRRDQFSWLRSRFL